MNILSTLLLLGLAALPVNAALEEEVVVLTAEDIAQKRCPVFFAVHRAGDTGVSIDFALRDSTAVAGDVGPYQLEVLKQPVTPADLPRKLTESGLIARLEVVRHERATFELGRDEIPNSAVMIYLAEGTDAGTRKIRGYCLPLAELMKTLPLPRRQLLTGTNAADAT
ncbi:MAG TPA: hypothetical protein VG734_21095 [Lacunisphaera sp.]|nr:hypothetical protein [Lacunisphaera sp.]